MLVDLKVKNFALIDKLEINFTRGLNVLTGETGAGKSIIIGALDMLLGSRASTDIVRKNKEKAYIEAVYEPEQLDRINDILRDSGIEPDPEILLLSREIRLNGRNRSRINGQLATLSMIRRISKYLVDIHGQHEHQSLLDPTLHLQLLDDYLGEDIEDIKNGIESIYREINDIDSRLKELQVDEGEKARQLDMLNFQIKEIEQANLRENEVEELKEEYNRLANMEEIYSVTGNIYNQINGEDFHSSSLLDQLGELMSSLEKIKDYDSTLNDFYQQINDVFYKLQDLSNQTLNYNESLDFNQNRLTEIEDRLDLLHNLQRKYGEKISDIIQYKNEMEAKKEKLKNQEEKIKKLKKRRERLIQQYYEMANKLSQIRKKKAEKLSRKIISEFKDLAMEETKFSVDFEEKEPGRDGIDNIEFLISPNPGEDLKPLAKIASGGELSRIMLALKTIIADIDKVDTLIFDEVDKGVGGKTAQKMAEKLIKISRRRQVICITHLPQIASMSDTHFFITKKVNRNHTFTTIYALEREEKKKELARMLGGVKLTDTTLKHAEEMLNMAENKKEKL